MDKLRPRRHSTVPTSFQHGQPSPEQSTTTANGSVETLYNHPAVRIIAFTSGRSFFNPGSGAEEKPGTLPSSSQFERTIAVGAFQIYRAPGSVAFLRCGSALQPILPKSQCWCIDETSSNFVLQIRRPNFWRIEVPVDGDENIRRALVLREVLAKVLQFERTPCPFERSFTVELPESPVTPVKKRPWAPTSRKLSMNWPPFTTTPSSPEFLAQAKFSNPGPRRFSDFGLSTSQTRNFSNSTTPVKHSDAQVIEGIEKDEKIVRPADELHKEQLTKEISQKEERDISPEEKRENQQAPAPNEVMAKAAAITNRPVYTSMQTAHKAAQSKETLAMRPLKIAESVPPPHIRKDKTSVSYGLEKLPAAKPLGIVKGVRPSAEATRPKPNDKEKLETLLKDPTTNGLSYDLVVSPAEFVMDHESEQSQKSGSDDEAVIEGKAYEGSGQMHFRRGRLAAFASRRAASAPQLNLRASTPSSSKSTSRFTSVIEEIDEEPMEPSSPADSQDSFHSIQSWRSLTTPLPPSPPLSPPEISPCPPESMITSRLISHEWEMSSSELTPTQAAWDTSSGTAGSSGIQTPNAVPSPAVCEEPLPLETSQSKAEISANNSQAAPEPVPIPARTPRVASDTESLSSSWSSAASSLSATKVQHRATTSVSISHNRAFSPLPSAANLFHSQSRQYDVPQHGIPSAALTAVRTIRKIPSVVFNKTCEILLAPPSHIINLMLKVAARIAAGEWRGFVFGLTEQGEVVDVRWDYSDTEGAVEGWEQGDYEWASSKRNSHAFKSNIKAPKASFAKSLRPRGKVTEYKDPWGSPSDEMTSDEWSRSWEVD